MSEQIPLKFRMFSPVFSQDRVRTQVSRVTMNVLVGVHPLWGVTLRIERGEARGSSPVRSPEVQIVPMDATEARLLARALLDAADKKDGDDGDPQMEAAE